jgi:hypothetical protein
MATARTTNSFTPAGFETHRQRAQDRLQSDRRAMPPDAMRLLRSVTAIAEELTELLDLVRADYPPLMLSGPDPIFVDLDQASAAAHDLHVNTRSAIEKLADR